MTTRHYPAAPYKLRDAAGRVFLVAEVDAATMPPTGTVVVLDDVNAIQTPRPDLGAWSHRGAFSPVTYNSHGPGYGEYRRFYLDDRTNVDVYNVRVFLGYLED